MVVPFLQWYPCVHLHEGDDKERSVGELGDALYVDDLLYLCPTLNRCAHWFRCTCDLWTAVKAFFLLSQCLTRPAYNYWWIWLLTITYFFGLITYDQYFIKSHQRKSKYMYCENITFMHRLQGSSLTFWPFAYYS